MRPLVLLAVLVLAGCQRVQVTVLDRSSGVAVVQAQAVQIHGDQSREIANADDRGRLAFTPEADGDVALRAQGFLLVSHPASWWLAQPQPLTIELEPVWLAEFQRTGRGAPSQVIERKPCPCHRSR